jgi:hypothetical protein
MTRTKTHIAFAASSFAVFMLAATTPARADYCIRLTGGSFSGDIGFFRISGARPTAAGSMTPMTGRAAGLSPLFGTAVVAKDGSYAEFGATFFIDSTQGQFDVSFNPPNATNGSGYAEYGEYGVNTGVTAKFVRCSGEP